MFAIGLVLLFAGFVIDIAYVNHMAPLWRESPSYWVSRIIGLLGLLMMALSLLIFLWRVLP